LRKIDLIYQTMYSELAQRSLDDAFASEFSAAGRFVPVDVKGKKYWYFDIPKADGPGQQRRYVGPVDDAEITNRVEHFKDLKADIRSRRKLVSTLVREAYLPRPTPITGSVVAALAEAGFFRLRGVLIGTVAFQCYSAHLGVRPQNSMMQTGDADFAQFPPISVAVDYSLPPIMDVLKKVDQTFREVPSRIDGRQSTQFVSREGFKVEFLTPNTGSADHDGKPVQMPALGGASAVSLRFLDYLLHQPIRAVMLHQAGVAVLVPAPERYAVHKLIVGSRRRIDNDVAAKSGKDRSQARALFEAMIEQRQTYDLASAYAEAWQRGDAWRNAIRRSVATFDDEFRKLMRRGVGEGLVEMGEDPAEFGLDEEPVVPVRNKIV
jgi:hypothetical protein